MPNRFTTPARLAASGCPACGGILSERRDPLGAHLRCGSCGLWWGVMTGGLPAELQTGGRPSGGHTRRNRKPTLHEIEAGNGGAWDVYQTRPGPG